MFYKSKTFAVEKSIFNYRFVVGTLVLNQREDGPYYIPLYSHKSYTKHYTKKKREAHF